MKLKVLLADDHILIRRSLKVLCEFQFGLETEIREARTCKELMKELEVGSITHVILDILLSDGNTITILPDIRELYPELQIMIISQHPKGVYMKAVQQYGVNHYCSKS